jgi:hypothetical protein
MTGRPQPSEKIFGATFGCQRVREQYGAIKWLEKLLPLKPWQVPWPLPLNFRSFDDPYSAPENRRSDSSEAKWLHDVSALE